MLIDHIHTQYYMDHVDEESPSSTFINCQSNMSKEDFFGPLFADNLPPLQDDGSQILFHGEDDSLLCIRNGRLSEIGSLSDCSASDSSDTLSRRRSALFDDEEDDIDLYSWSFKPVEEWNKVDTINWLIRTGSKIGHSYSRMSPKLAMSGKELYCLSLQDFLTFDQDFGKKLFNSLQKRMKETYSLSGSEYSSDDETTIGTDTAPSDEDCDVSGVRRSKKRLGRPPTKKVKEPRIKLWEFIRNALFDPKLCPEYICWEDYEQKTFRFVKSAHMAKLWGERDPKKNKTKKMTFENFSRAMRYYYKQGIFAIVPGRRLVYKFGDNATGLETDCPNFDPHYYGHVKQS